MSPTAIKLAGQPFSVRPVSVTRKEKTREDYAFQRQFDEKPSVIPGCPGLYLCYAKSAQMQHSDSNKCKHVKHSCSVTNVKNTYNFDISKDVLAVCRTNVSNHAVCVQQGSNHFSAVRTAV